jgi:hypothetical protein
VRPTAVCLYECPSLSGSPSASSDPTWGASPAARRSRPSDAQNTSPPRRQFLRSGAIQPVSAMYLARSVRIFATRTVCWDETSYDPQIPRPPCVLRAASPRLRTEAAGAGKPVARGGFPSERGSLVQIPQWPLRRIPCKVAGSSGVSRRLEPTGTRQLHAIAWEGWCRRRLQSCSADLVVPEAPAPRGTKGFLLA